MSEPTKREVVSIEITWSDGKVERTDGTLAAVVARAIVDPLKYAGEAHRLRYEVEWLRAKLEAASEKLRTIARRYQQDDGEPGDLSGNCWGWRTIAENLRWAADQVEREANSK